MGITIHYKLTANKLALKDTLDRTQKLAETFKSEADKLNIPFSIERPKDSQLYINIEGCETLTFDFYTPRELSQYKGKDAMENGVWNEGAWQYERYMQDEGGLPDEGYNIDIFPKNEKAYASGFCKTQFATSIFGHLWIAELIRITASYCIESYVNDEGDYYHTGKIEDASQSIEQLGKMIDGMANMFSINGFDILQNKTNIKSTKKKN